MGKVHITNYGDICLMPNHFHTLIKIKSLEQILKIEKFAKLVGAPAGFKNMSGLMSKKFGNFFNSYAKAFNKMYDRKGSLSNSPFKVKEIDSDTYLSNVIFYIHHNPVHHGFVLNIGDWPHSSYHSLLSGKPTNLQRGYVQKWFNERGEMKKFHLQSMKGLELLELEFT